jgi:hypothetical protein
MFLRSVLERISSEFKNVIGWKSSIPSGKTSSDALVKRMDVLGGLMHGVDCVFSQGKK